MTKLFGTDGIRGIVPKELNVSLAVKVGIATSMVLKNNDDNVLVLVGTDTRNSKDCLSSAIISGLLSNGANVIDLGVIPTPAVAYLIKKYNATGGIVISASHNPSIYNGIKIFNSEGYKLDDEKEELIENIIANNEFVYSDKCGTLEVNDNAISDYTDYLISTVNSDFSNLHIGVDTANGAAFKTAEVLFEKLNIKYELINNKPDGLNINDECGSTHLDGLIKLVKDKNLDCGIAYDGDADRCLMIDNEGNIIDGDYILAIASNYLKENNNLTNNTIVGTVMSNLGLVKYCGNNNINFVSTKVGDRFVLECMNDNGYILGGEQSGHIIFREYATTGDGELTSIQILNVMSKTNKSLKELSSIMKKYPQVLKNVEVNNTIKLNYQNNANIQNIIKECNKELNGNGRILVRASGTENLIRVMLEGENITNITEMCDKIVSVIKKENN